jgi:hypothetical protein
MDGSHLHGRGVGQVRQQPGKRSASIVLPAPGGPVSNMWCAPAAATSKARRASPCPDTSAMSGTSGACPQASSQGHRSSTGRSRGRVPGVSAKIEGQPGQGLVAANLRSRDQRSLRSVGIGHHNVRVAGLNSRHHGRKDAPDGPQSPIEPQLRDEHGSADFADVTAARSTAMVMARSKPEPRLGRDAGMRLAVIFLLLRGIPEFWAADRMRSGLR